MELQRVDETTLVRHPAMGIEISLESVRADAYRAAKKVAETEIPSILKTRIGSFLSCDYAGRPFKYFAADIWTEITESEEVDDLIGCAASLLYGFPCHSVNVSRKVLADNLKTLIEGHAQHMADQAVRVYQAECGV